MGCGDMLRCGDAMGCGDLTGSGSPMGCGDAGAEAIHGAAAVLYVATIHGAAAIPWVRRHRRKPEMKKRRLARSPRFEQHMSLFGFLSFEHKLGPPRQLFGEVIKQQQT